MTKSENIQAIAEQCKQYIHIREFVNCGNCKKRVVIWMLFKCLYCGIFFCRECANEHFGPNLLEKENKYDHSF